MSGLTPGPEFGARPDVLWGFTVVKHGGIQRELRRLLKPRVLWCYARELEKSAERHGGRLTMTGIFGKTGDLESRHAEGISPELEACVKAGYINLPDVRVRYETVDTYDLQPELLCRDLANPGWRY
jgi:hypothetical protein